MRHVEIKDQLVQQLKNVESLYEDLTNKNKSGSLPKDYDMLVLSSTVDDTEYDIDPEILYTNGYVGRGSELVDEGVPVPSAHDFYYILEVEHWSEPEMENFEARDSRYVTHGPSSQRHGVCYLVYKLPDEENKRLKQGYDKLSGGDNTVDIAYPSIHPSLDSLTETLVVLKQRVERSETDDDLEENLIFTYAVLTGNVPQSQYKGRHSWAEAEALVPIIKLCTAGFLPEKFTVINQMSYLERLKSFPSLYYDDALTAERRLRGYIDKLRRLDHQIAQCKEMVSGVNENSVLQKVEALESQYARSVVDAIRQVGRNVEQCLDDMTNARQRLEVDVFEPGVRAFRDASVNLVGAIPRLDALEADCRRYGSSLYESVSILGHAFGQYLEVGDNVTREVRAFVQCQDQFMLDVFNGIVHEVQMLHSQNAHLLDV